MKMSLYHMKLLGLIKRTKTDYCGLTTDDDVTV